MARPVWSGSLTFGLVTLPVSLTAATTSHTVRFHRLERGTSDRVRNRRVNERTGKEVPYDKIVKGYDTGEGEYVVVEPDELDAVTPGRSQSIEIEGFVELDAIEPVYFDATYFLQPRREPDANVYGLLRDALQEAGRAGIATMSMHQKDYLVAVHTENGILVLHTLHWADEVRDPEQELANLPAGSRRSSRELKMARQLVDAMAMEWDPHDYRDATRERVRELVEAKRKGESVEKGEPAPSATNVVDLSTALQDSVDRARKDRGGRSGGGRREDGARKEGGGRSRRTAKSGTGRSSARGALDRLTKAELYDRAADAGVKGRSSMTRDELRDALSRSASGRKAAS